MDVRTIPFNTISGHTTSLAAFADKVLLIVNTASECGFTHQYSSLQNLYEHYKDRGLVIVGFPSNDFGGQEPGSNDQIAAFCKLSYGVTFPMMAKVSVKGTDKHPLFAYLTEKSPLPGEIKWNFGKFLIDKQGILVARFGSSTSPSDSGLVSQIEALLTK
jgi:glutathione peroxidase